MVLERKNKSAMGRPKWRTGRTALERSSSIDQIAESQVRVERRVDSLSGKLLFVVVVGDEDSLQQVEVFDDFDAERARFVARQLQLWVMDLLIVDRKRSKVLS